MFFPPKAKSTHVQLLQNKKHMVEHHYKVESFNIIWECFPSSSHLQAPKTFLPYCCWLNFSWSSLSLFSSSSSDFKPALVSSTSLSKLLPFFFISSFFKLPSLDTKKHCLTIGLIFLWSSHISSSLDLKTSSSSSSYSSSSNCWSSELFWLFALQKQNSTPKKTHTNYYHHKQQQQQQHFLNTKKRKRNCVHKLTCIVILVVINLELLIEGC